MRKVLLAWIGKTDLRAPTESDQVGVGPIARAVEVRAFDEAFLISDSSDEKLTQKYLKWLCERTAARIAIVDEKLSGPMHFGEIYEAAVRTVQLAVGDAARDTALTFQNYIAQNGGIEIERFEPSYEHPKPDREGLVQWPAH